MSPLRPLLVFGTRPEAIKLAPVILECRRRAADVVPIICHSGQHREMVAQVLGWFDIVCDIQLDLLSPGQSLSVAAARCLCELDGVMERVGPDCVVVQGDTTTVLAASLAAFYRQVPVVHVEAGLRTGNLRAPWPEEFNRRVASLSAALHCAPTRLAARHLRAEGVPAHRIHVTGNPVVDALLWTLERLRGSGGMWEEKYAFLGDRHVVLITGHRRESFGHGFENICAAIRQLSMKFPQVEFVYPVHPNPQVRQPVCDRLGDCQNIHLVAPAPYPEFVWLMERAAVILTDSGGVEEESPTLRKPVVVMRRATDRQEIVRVGAGLLVGTRPERIVSAVSRLLTDREAYRFMQVERNPYGDGQAAVRIVDRMLDRPWLRDGAARHRPAPPEVARRRKTAGTQRPLAQRHSGLRRPQLRRARRS